ncbi:Peroxisomal membrane protein 13-like protein [Drosera capensis]
MAAPTPPGGGADPPPKPWERAGASSSGPVPFKPPSSGSTGNVVEASGTAKPGEIVSTSNRNTAGVGVDAVGRPLPRRPWENNGIGNTIGGSDIRGYGSTMNYNTGYGSSMYNSYGGGGYGGMYNNSMYRGGFGGGMYGSGMHGGGGMYGGGLGAPMGGYGMGMGGGQFGGQDPNNPFGSPPSPPGFWISFLRVMEGIVSFFGRISILVDQNTQAVHLFMSALLQLFDRGGVLYGELARFVFRILGMRTKHRKVPGAGPDGLPLPASSSAADQIYTNEMAVMKGSKATSGGAWDNVWRSGEVRHSARSALKSSIAPSDITIGAGGTQQRCET